MAFFTPAGVAAGASALSSLTGLAGAAGLFGSGDNYGNNVRVEPWTKYTWQKGYDLARDQFDVLTSSAVQRRVADAKAAGLHPLFAMGMSAPGGVGAPPGGQFASGGSKTDVTRRVALAMEAFNNAQDLARSQIRKTDAEADLTESVAARAAQPASPGQVPGVTDVTEPVVPTRPFWKQVMKSDGSLSAKEPEERFFGWIAEEVRDAVRRGQARRAERLRRKEIRRRRIDAVRQKYNRPVPKRNWYDLY